MNLLENSLLLTCDYRKGALRRGFIPIGVLLEAATCYRVPMLNMLNNNAVIRNHKIRLSWWIS